MTEHKPKDRSECRGGERPCPWASCRYNLQANLLSKSVRLNHPGLDIDELEETCTLDVADRGPHSTVTIARLLGITKQRVEQIEKEALRKVRAANEQAA